MRKEPKKRGHLSLKFQLAIEISDGMYPELTKDLIHLKLMKEKGQFVLPEDKLLSNKSISKIDAFNVLRNLGQDIWELFILFDMIPKHYSQVLK